MDIAVDAYHAVWVTDATGNTLTKLDSTSNNLNAILSDENQASFKSALADIAAVAHQLDRTAVV